MFQLTQATQEAFDKRQIRLYPLLSVYDEAGKEHPISPTLIINRPARQFSPVTTRSPVVRLDLELAPSPEILSLFLEQRVVVYREIVNGQEFPRFTGRIEAIEKGWAIKKGVVTTALKVTAYSTSQRLKAAGVEIFHRTKTEDVSGLLEATCVWTHTVTHAARAASGNDPLGINAAFSPHWYAEPVTITWHAGGVDYLRYGGTDFWVREGAESLEVEWVANAPAAGTAYTLKYKAPVAFVCALPFQDYPSIGPVPASMGAYHLDYDQEVTVEAIANGNLAYQRYYSPSDSRPFVRIQKGGSTAEPVQDPITDWEFALDRGWFRYVGKARIFDQFSSDGTETTFVGVTGLAWPQESAPENQAESLIGEVYRQAGILSVAYPYAGFTPTGITVSEGTMRGTGEEVLRGLNDLTPPNYIVYDDELGMPRSRFFTQKLAPDLELKTVKGLSHKEAPEMHTRVVVRSIVPDQPVDPERLASGFLFAADGYEGALYDDDGYWAELAFGAYFVQVAYKFGHVERFASARLRFEGEVMVMIADAAEDGSIDYDTMRYAPGLSRVVHDAMDEVTIGEEARSLFSDENMSGRYLILRLWPTVAVPTPKLYHLELRCDKVMNCYAVITDFSGDGNNWIPITEPLEPGWMAGIGYYRNVGAGIVRRWLIDPVHRHELDGYLREWWKHRNRIIELPGLNRERGNAIARAYLEDTLRRASAEEVEVVLEPAAQVGDTVLVRDMSTGASYLRLIVGYRDGTSWTEPSTVLELVDFD